ncbi:hypothetical protein BD770DRAFT_413574 [Pilaira anomala]|nr:hypothetical protein BD770DRAFT_413574 [Pilaira anomala]
MPSATGYTNSTDETTTKTTTGNKSKSSTASSARFKINRTLARIEKMKRESMGRKLDMTFYRQLHEHRCCECGRSDFQTKELTNAFNMAKVMKDMKDMIFSIYKKSCELAFVGFLFFGRANIEESKSNVSMNVWLPVFPVVTFLVPLCDSSAGYFSRINNKRTLFFYEEKPIICVIQCYQH